MSTINWAIFVVAAIILIISGLTILYNLIKGDHKTKLTDKFVWGLNIQIFYALSSFGAGLMGATILLAGSNLPVLILQVGASIALACLLAGIIMMGIDLGHPARAIKILLAKKVTSPLTLDFLATTLLVILSILLTIGVGTGTVAAMKIWAYLALLASMICLGSHTLLLASRFEAGFRSSPFNSAETLACSLWSGVAIMALISMGNAIQGAYVTMLLVFSLISLVKGICAAISTILGKDSIHTYKKAFIALASISALILIIGDLANINQGALVVIASLLSLAAVVTEKSASVLSVQKRSGLPAPFNSLEPEQRYVPSATEIVHLLFSIAMIAVIPYGVFILRFIA
jgi:Ni/Fe-hydrogenase subunit HybB-like protein